MRPNIRALSLRKSTTSVKWRSMIQSGIAMLIHANKCNDYYDLISGESLIRTKKQWGKFVYLQ